MAGSHQRSQVEKEVADMVDGALRGNFETRLRWKARKASSSASSPKA
jgi:hypothetical protein